MQDLENHWPMSLMMILVWKFASYKFTIFKGAVIIWTFRHQQNCLDGDNNAGTFWKWKKQFRLDSGSYRIRSCPDRWEGDILGPSATGWKRKEKKFQDESWKADEFLNLEKAFRAWGSFCWRLARSLSRLIRIDIFCCLGRQYMDCWTQSRSQQAIPRSWAWSPFESF